VPRGSQHSAAKRRKEKERQAKQAAKREKRLHKGEPGAENENSDALVREYLGLPTDQEGEETAATGDEDAEDDAEPQQ
jgi:hypothetical protein